MTTVWSYGGGTQTAAIWALIEAGALPRPDLTVIADTGLESTVTLHIPRIALVSTLATRAILCLLNAHAKRPPNTVLFGGLFAQ